MSSETTAPNQPAWMTWTGRVLTALPVLGLAMSAAMKFSGTPEMVEQIGKLGFTESQIRNIAFVEIACTIIYLIPQTAVLGAILLTGYLGGATATHVRINEPFAPCIILGVIIWLGLYFRDARVRALAPFRRI